MSDVPKPLPRTKIRSRPVQIAEYVASSDDAKNNAFIQFSKVDETSAAQNVEKEQTKNATVGANRANDISSTAKQLVEENHENDAFRPIEKTNTGTEDNKRSSNSINEIITKTTRLLIDDEDVVDRSGDSKILPKTIFDIETDSRSVKSDSTKSERSENTATENQSARTSSSSTKSNNSAEIDESSINTIEETIVDEHLFGVHVHRSDCLQIDRVMKHPSVIVHIVNDENNGRYLQKSKPDKNVTYNQETSSFILPVMTKPFNFKEHKCMIPTWEEVLTFNENVCHILKSSTVLFFEIVDFVDSSYSNDEYSSVIGWHRICWAFLRPFASNNAENVDKMLRLQLYRADPKSSSITSSDIPYVYKWFRSKRWKPYPSTLYVTIKRISSCKIDSKPQQRSCTPLQPEVGSDASVKSLGLVSSDGEDNANGKNPEYMSAIYRLSDIEWSRIVGQSCRLPNFKMATLYPNSKGSLAIKFSNSGLFLACGTCNDVFIYAIDGILERKLVSHQGLIYTLYWYTDDSLLLSSSADCTVCVWDTKSSSEVPLQVLPHPSFVYCSMFVLPESTIVSGCYDGVVRIWWQEHACSKFWQLHQELTGHEEYVNALCSFRNKEFFSGDSVGVIIHWKCDEYGRWFKLNVIKLSEIQGAIINALVSFPGGKRLLIHTRDSLLRMMDIRTSVIIQWYQGGLNDSSQCSGTITPCGSYVFAISEDGTVNVWESNTGKQVAFYSRGLSITGCGGSVDFHPFDHIAAFSFYSAGYDSSSVNLLKYSPNNNNQSDISLYILNGGVS